MHKWIKGSLCFGYTNNWPTEIKLFSLYFINLAGTSFCWFQELSSGTANCWLAALVRCKLAVWRDWQHRVIRWSVFSSLSRKWSPSSRSSCSQLCARGGAGCWGCPLSAPAPHAGPLWLPLGTPHFPGPQARTVGIECLPPLAYSTPTCRKDTHTLGEYKHTHIHIGTSQYQQQ